MRVLSVNVGREEPIAGAKSSGKTGIFKRPVDTPVMISANGLSGDEISDKENHGGVDQAVYLFGAPDYEWWSQELGRELEPGTFGENLVISGLESARVCIGDRFSAGSTVLEVTAPRIPCVTLAVRMGEPAFPKRFRRAERPGLYCRVIRPGEVSAGDTVRVEQYSGVRVPAIEVFRAFFDPDPGEAVLRRHLAAPLAVRAREMDEERLARAMERRTGEEHRLSEIEQVTVSMDGFEVNSYVVHAPEGDVIVDAGAEPEKILGAVRAPVAAVLVTHAHADHVDALDTVLRETNAPVYVHPDAAEGAGVSVYEPLDGGQELSLAGETFRVLHTPGHAVGSVTFVVGRDQIVGDLILPGSVGRTDIDGASWEDLEVSLRKVMPLWEDETRLYTGHGPVLLAREQLEKNPYLPPVVS